MTLSAAGATHISRVKWGAGQDLRRQVSVSCFHRRICGNRRHSAESALVSREVKLTPLVPVLVIHGCTCLDEVGKIPRVMLHYKKCKRVRNITR